MELNAPTKDEEPRTRFWVPEFATLGDLAMKAYEFMVGNPHMMNYFEHFALEALAAEFQFGIGQLTERIRWEVNLYNKIADEKWKISNNHRAYISRWLLLRYPQLVDFLVVHQVTNDNGKSQAAPPPVPKPQPVPKPHNPWDSLNTAGTKPGFIS